MTDEQIETERVAGEITLVLRQGTPAERDSLLCTIERLCGLDERLRLESWIAEGMPEPNLYDNE